MPDDNALGLRGYVFHFQGTEESRPSVADLHCGHSAHRHGRALFSSAVLRLSGNRRAACTVPRGVAGFNEGLIADYRANGKPTKGPFVGRQVLLLTTTGAKTGHEHTNPLVWTKDGDKLVIVASKGGAPTNPSWYHNLRANPVVTIELGKDRFAARASVAKPESERRRLYDQHAATHPGFTEYEKRTTRRIPVITLERIGPNAA
jgi:deazaflavin-dependent oxidoreductase (nitroreductase family)